jgi:phthalate 4,5-dioxygenase oxygenase subunit
MSCDLTPGDQPREVRILGEDLVLFRDQDGKPGLLGLHCSHRLVSLAYGRVEDGGIRCPMHGWLYDVAGRCLEQPAEPDAMFKDRIQHTAYPCQDLGGLTFAYMGPPDRMPLLPRYDLLVRTDGTRRAEWYAINGGYLQHLEGAQDTIHASYLHQADWSVNKHEIAKLPKPHIDFEQTGFGLWQRSHEVLPGAVQGVTFGHFFMPAGFVLQTVPHEGNGGEHASQGSQNRRGSMQRSLSWYVPVDDGRCLRFRVAFAPLNADGSPQQLRPDAELVHPRADQDYGRDYHKIDSITGIDPAVQSTFRSQDTMANETQGFPVVDRRLEHLGAHDSILTAMRMMILKGIADVQKGLDPTHIIRDPEENEMVFLRGTDEREYFASERDPRTAASIR